MKYILINWTIWVCNGLDNDLTQSCLIYYDVMTVIMVLTCFNESTFVGINFYIWSNLSFVVFEFLENERFVKIYKKIGFNYQNVEITWLCKLSSSTMELA